MAAYLIKFEGYNAKEAMDEVISVRPIAFSAEGWMDFGLDVLKHYQTHNKRMQPDRQPATPSVGR